jgi:hypothetical protein
MNNYLSEIIYRFPLFSSSFTNDVDFVHFAGSDVANTQKIVFVTSNMTACAMKTIRH